MFVVQYNIISVPPVSENLSNINNYFMNLLLNFPDFQFIILENQILLLYPYNAFHFYLVRNWQLTMSFIDLQTFIYLLNKSSNIHCVLKFYFWIYDKGTCSVEENTYLWSLFSDKIR